MRNDQMEQCLRCTPADLGMLKREVKKQMMLTEYEGKPLLGQLIGEIDPDHIHRNRMWENIASQKKLRDILTGKKWGNHKPKDFESNIRKIQDQIISDHNMHVRRDMKSERGSGDGAFQPAEAGLADSGCQSDESVSATHRRTQGKKSSLLSFKDNSPNTKPISTSTMGTVDTLAGPPGNFKQPADQTRRPEPHDENTRAAIAEPEASPGTDGIEETRAVEEQSQEGIQGHDPIETFDFDLAANIQSMVKNEVKDQMTEARQTQTAGLKAAISTEVERQTTLAYKNLGATLGPSVRKLIDEKFEAQLQKRVGEERATWETALDQVVEEKMKQREGELVGRVSAQVVGSISRGFQGLKRGS